MLGRAAPGNRLLIAEDDRAVRDSLTRALELEGYTVTAVGNGAEALDAAGSAQPDVVVLDVSMPIVDGLTVCKVMRADGNRVPILMLTARTETRDRVAGLDAGADDYLPKPFSFAELNARLRALTRRGVSERPAVVEVGDLRLDPATRQVWRGAVEIQLSTKEFALLDTLMRRAGLVLSRLQLLEHAWDYAYENRSNVVDVYIRYLREKVDRPFGRESIETVRGAGYRLRKDG
jgi:two-component system OmpR family response regulator